MYSSTKRKTGRGTICRELSTVGLCMAVFSSGSGDGMEYQPEKLKLKEIREEKGFSQEYIAYYLHTTRQQVSIWEKGIRMMGVDKYIRLSVLYRVTVDYLLGITDTRK